MLIGISLFSVVAAVKSLCHVRLKAIVTLSLVGETVSMLLCSCRLCHLRWEVNVAAGATANPRVIANTRAKVKSGRSRGLWVTLVQSFVGVTVVNVLRLVLRFITNWRLIRGGGVEWWLWFLISQDLSSKLDSGTYANINCQSLPWPSWASEEQSISPFIASSFAVDHYASVCLSVLCHNPLNEQHRRTLGRFNSFLQWCGNHGLVTIFHRHRYRSRDKKRKKHCEQVATHPRQHLCSICHRLTSIRWWWQSRVSKRGKVGQVGGIGTTPAKTTTSKRF